MIRQYELVERVKHYDPNCDEDVLNRAYVFALRAHGSQKRANGDPYFSHPLEVAGILTDMRLDESTIATALLHDVIEDTEATLADIERQFGGEIARLVDGVTKLSRIELQSDHTKQAENFRKLVLAMSADIRVLLVKLADRLHNMRTLYFIKDPSKRRRIAVETMEIYAPLAERIGMQKMRDELEDLSFTEINPDARASILQRLEFLRGKGGDLVNEVKIELSALLREACVPAHIDGREKKPYSIWRKMQLKDVSFEQLSDIMAFRITVDTIGDCYAALGIIHGRYPNVPGRFKDYISAPKPNGYRSLHTGVIGSHKQRIEIQIRTKEMDEQAELGAAAHWQYKQSGSSRPAETDGDGPDYRWLRDLLEIIETSPSPDEFLEHTKLEMYQDQVFCFTPKGDVYSLPRGATPVDFAYAVHSQLGDTCVGAKINGRIVQLRAQLNNGDQVEIVTSKGQTPSPDWEEFVVSGKAKARIRRFIRLQRRQQYAQLGRSIVERAFRQEGYPFSEKGVEGVLKSFRCESVEDLYAEVGEGVHTGREVVHAIFPGLKTPAAPKIPGVTTPPKAKKPDGGGHALPIRGLIAGMAMHYARCCHPLPGDRIVGIVTTGKGVTIHTIDCVSLEAFADMPERWLDVSWDEEDGSVPHVGRIHVVLTNEPGSMGSLCTVIGKNQGNISNLKITSRSQDFFEMLLDVEVKDVRHLTNVIAALRATPAITSVERSRG